MYTGLKEHVKPFMLPKNDKQGCHCGRRSSRFDRWLIIWPAWATAPTIYRGHAQALGGMTRYGIPQYRLPKEILDWEIEGILELGVEAHCNGMTLGEGLHPHPTARAGLRGHLPGRGRLGQRAICGLEGEDLDGVMLRHQTC